MNWSIKDENMKNMLWTERCRRDLSRSRGPAGAWNMSQESLQRNVLSRDVNNRDSRFLSGSASLLASLSRYVSADNNTPQAAFVRSFSALRKEKTTRPPLRAHGHRAVSAMGRERTDDFAASCTAPASHDAAPPKLPVEAATLLPDGARPQTAVRPGTATVRTDSAPLPSRVDIRRPLSAMAMRNAREPKWLHPVAMSDAYGWRPSTPALWEDHRFKHPLSTTDVTRMGSMKVK